MCQSSVQHLQLGHIHLEEIVDFQRPELLVAESLQRMHHFKQRQDMLFHHLHKGYRYRLLFFRVDVLCTGDADKQFPELKSIQRIRVVSAILVFRFEISSFEVKSELFRGQILIN